MQTQAVEHIVRTYGQRTRHAIRMLQPSRAKQSFKDECDINVIMRHWNRTGHLLHKNEAQPRYGDFSTVDDFQAAQNIVIQANEAFLALPAAVRDRMHNSPAELLRFVADADNLEEAIELGLVDKPEETPAPPAPPEPPVVVPPQPDPPGPDPS